MADETQQQQPQPENPVDPLILKAALQRLRSEQNLVLAVLAGGAAALLGAGVWAAITFATSFQIGWMAVGVGFLVGYAVRTFGKGVDKSFAVVGAVWSLAGCAVGNLLSVIGVISKHQNIPFFDILEKLDPEIVASLMQTTFNPMDLLFYGIAVYEGYRFSLRQITQADLMKIG
jgi:Ni/Fe-hydrogenase subunit HybB-like protein